MGENFFIYVNSKKQSVYKPDRRFNGVAIHFETSEIIRFNSCADMVVKIDQMLSGKFIGEYAQREQMKYQHPWFLQPYECFFLLNILYTQNNSWQGILKYRGGSRLIFKSREAAMKTIWENVQIKYADKKNDGL